MPTTSAKVFASEGISAAPSETAVARVAARRCLFIGLSHPIGFRGGAGLKLISASLKICRGSADICYERHSVISELTTTGLPHTGFSYRRASRGSPSVDDVG